jgi:hypothetical protein
MTASEITKWAKKQLEDEGCRLNRVNNIPVHRRKGTIERGWSDLQGYTEDGQYVAIEVKTSGDKLSVYQKQRLDDIVDCKGLAYIATEVEGLPILRSWTGI